MFFLLTVSSLFLPQWWLASIRSRNPMPLPEKWCFIWFLLSSVSAPCSTLEKQHLPIEKGSFRRRHLISATFSCCLRHLAPEGQIYQCSFFKDLRICLCIMSVGLTDPFQKFMRVFVFCFCFFAEVLGFCSDSLALVPLF